MGVCAGARTLLPVNSDPGLPPRHEQMQQQSQDPQRSSSGGGMSSSSLSRYGSTGAVQQQQLQQQQRAEQQQHQQALAVFPTGLPVHEHLFYRDLQVSKLAGEARSPRIHARLQACRCHR